MTESAETRNTPMPANTDRHGATSHAQSVTPTQGTGPMKGMRILDLSTVVAGPLAATLLADMGAEVLKVEMPGVGDHIRHLPPHKNGISLWSKVTNRNKRSITLDLRQPAGVALLEQLLPDYDVLIENFRPGTLERWGLDGKRLRSLNAGLVVLRVTGFGQTGPYADRPGFARIFEALSGFAHLCGEADGPPMYPGFPVSDAMTGVFGAYSVAAALLERSMTGKGQGQEIDLSATEAMFRVMDFMAIEFDQLGVVRKRKGNLNAYSAPSDVYRTQDDKWIVLAASSPTVFARLSKAWNRPDLLTDPRFDTNVARITNRSEIESIAQEWFRRHTLDQALAVMRTHEVSCSPIMDIRDIFEDPHMQAREAILSIDDARLGPIRMQNVVPRYSRTPGKVWRSGPEAGEHNAEVLGTELGLSAHQIAELKARQIV